MDVKMQKSWNVFISYSHRDRELRDELEIHLSNLKRQNIISSWYDGDIVPGAEWEVQILEHLKSAQIILLLLSADFISSDFCYTTEMKEAIARHDAKDACVIPILLRPTDWKDTPFARLQMLPTDAKPVTKWPTHDDAFEDITLGIRKVLNHLTDASASRPLLSPVVEQRPSAIAQLVQEVQVAFGLQDWHAVEDKTSALMQIASNAFTPALWQKRGLALLAIGAPLPALEALERALSAEPHDVPTLQAKGTALLKAHRVEEACQAFGLAYSLTPYDDIPFRLRTLADLVEVLSRADKWDEALRRAEEGMRLAPNDEGWQRRIQIVRLAPVQVEYDAAMRAQQWDEAHTACTKALRHAPGDEGWQQRQAQIGTARASAELRHRLTDGSYLEKKLREEGVEAVVTELAQGEYDETLHNLAVAIRCGTVVLKQAPEEIWNQAKGRADIVLHSSRPRSMPRFDLRFATLFPADEALVRVLSGHTLQVHDCAFSPDGRWILTASDDCTLRLWDITSGETMRVFEGFVWKRSTFSSDGEQILSVGYQTLRLWNIASGETVHDFEVNTEAYVNGYSFSSDGRWVLCASEDKMLRLWDVASGVMVRIFAGHTAEVNGCAFSPDGRYALSASSDRTLRLWDVASGETVRIFKGHTGKVAGCAFSPDGQQALSIGYEMRLWDVAKGKTIYTFEDIYSSSGNGCTFSPDGRKALSFGRTDPRSDDSHMLWDVANGVMIRRFEIKPVLIWSYISSGDTSGGTFSPDGRRVLFGSKDGTLRLLDVASGAEVRVFNNNDTHSKRCAFSPDGRQVLSAGRDLLLWDVANGSVVRSFKGHTDEINSCTFSSDGRYVLSASDDGTLRLWNVTRGRELARWTTDTPLLCCAIRPDNETVIAGDNMGGLHFLSIVI
jgi:WD40 repeat protein/tetratricopeptide (TPR) repeat protein